MGGAVKYAALAVVLGLSGMTTEAVAQPAGPDDAALREAARVEFERGVSAAREQRWDEAVRSFQRARDLRATPSVQFNLGMACRSAGRYREGVSALEAFLGTPGATPDPLRVRAASEALGAMRAGMSRLTVMVVPERARVTVDGADVTAPSTVELDPGEHRVGAEAQGYTPRTETLRLAEAEARVLSLRLEALPTAVAQSTLAMTQPEVPRRPRAIPWVWIGIGAGALAVVVVTSLVVGLSRDEPPAQGALGHVTDAVMAR